MPGPGGLLLGVPGPRGCLVLGEGLLLGVPGPRGCLVLWGSAPGGAWSWGVAAPRGCLLPGGFPACNGADPLWTEFLTHAEKLPCRNFVAGGNTQEKLTLKQSKYFFWNSPIPEIYILRLANGQVIEQMD